VVAVSLDAFPSKFNQKLSFGFVDWLDQKRANGRYADDEQKSKQD